MHKPLTLFALLGLLLAALWPAHWALADDPGRSLEAAFSEAVGKLSAQTRSAAAYEISPAQRDADLAYVAVYLLAADGQRQANQFLVLLATYEPAGWTVLVPSQVPAADYNALLDRFPDTLLDTATRALLRQPESTTETNNFSRHRLPWPAGQIGYVTQKDGSYHQSQVDFDILGWGNSGAVYASRPGTVVFVKESSNSGCCDLSCWQQANMVVVQHNAGEYSWYVHLAPGSVPVSVGQEIGLGQQVGVEGETGYACGVHLHYMASTGYTGWTDPQDAYSAPWGTGITQVDFDEVSWDAMTVGLSYVSQNQAASLSQIGGRVTDSLGQPLEGVTVTTTSGRSTTTNQNGAYSIDQLEAGSYTLAVEHPNSFSPAARTVSVPPDRSGVDFQAYSLNLTIDSVTLLPALAGQPLVAGKALGVLVELNKSGDGVVSDVPLRLSDGTTAVTRFYVLAEANRSPDTGALLYDNGSYSLDFAAGAQSASVFFVAPAPAAGPDYQVTVTVNPDGELLETNTSDNSASSPAASVVETRWGALAPELELAFTSLDWDDDQPMSRYHTAVQASSSLLQGAWPVAAADLDPYAATTAVDSTTYRNPAGLLDLNELQDLALATAPLLRLAAPNADQLLLTVPAGWFAAETHLFRPLRADRALAAGGRVEHRGSSSRPACQRPRRCPNFAPTGPQLWPAGRATRELRRRVPILQPRPL